MADASLLRWLRHTGASWRGVRLQLAEGGQRGYSVVSTRPIPAGQPIALIPKRALLSIRSASSSALLLSLVDQGCPAEAALVMAIAHERSLAQASRWAAYLGSLPRCEHVPTLWSVEEWRWLRVIGMEEEAVERRRELEREHAAILQLLRSVGEESEWAGEADLEAQITPCSAGHTTSTPHTAHRTPCTPLHSTHHSQPHPRHSLLAHKWSGRKGGREIDGDSVRER